MGRARRQLVIQYAEFVATCRILGFADLLAGSPAIEQYRQHENSVIARRRQKSPKAVTPLPLPPLEDMISAAEARFRRGGVPEDLEGRAKRWAVLKREALANG